MALISQASTPQQVAAYYDLALFALALGNFSEAEGLLETAALKLSLRKTVQSPAKKPTLSVPSLHLSVVHYVHVWLQKIVQFFPFHSVTSQPEARLMSVVAEASPGDPAVLLGLRVGLLLAAAWLFNLEKSGVRFCF